MTPRPGRATPPLRTMPAVESMHRTFHDLHLVEALPSPSRGRRRWPALATLVGLATIATTLEPPPPRHLPSSLVGTWRSESPSHAGRTLVLGRDMLAFGGGDVAPVPHAVTAVSTRLRNDSTILTVAYEDDGAPATLRLAWETAAPEALLVGAGAGGRWVKR